MHLRDAVITVFGALLACFACYGQDVTAVREWIDASKKFKIQARLVELDGQNVKISRADGTVLQLKRAQLSERDNGYLDAVHAIHETVKQLPLLLPHLSAIQSPQAATIQVLDALSTQFPQAIGARFFSSLLLAESADARSSDLTRAARQFDELIKTLETMETHFPGRFRSTLASALNNRAVVAVRQHNLVSAVNFLTKSTEVSSSPIPFATYHNASLLLASDVDLGASRTKLATVLAKGSPEAASVVPSRFMYTYTHDSFSIENPKQTDDATEAGEPRRPAPGNFKLKTGSGFLIAPSLVITNRHVVEDADAFLLRNDSGEEVSADILAVSPVAEVDLAILKLERSVDYSPIPFRTADPNVGESFVVLGYPIPDQLESSLTASRGIISKLVENELQMLHDASTDPGNSGGPCLDSRGNVVGVHFSAAPGKNNRNLAVTSLGVRQFLLGVDAYEISPQQTQELSFEQIIQQVKNSVFLIECYGKEMSPRIRTPTAQNRNTDAIKQHHLVPDRSCLRCFGRGYVDCPRCINGYNSVSRTVKVGVNTLTGESIFAPKSFRTKCGSCNPSGNLNCSGCSGTGWSK